LTAVTTTNQMKWAATTTEPSTSRADSPANPTAQYAHTIALTFRSIMASFARATADTPWKRWTRQRRRPAFPITLASMSTSVVRSRRICVRSGAPIPKGRSSVGVAAVIWIRVVMARFVRLTALARTLSFFWPTGRI